MSLADKAASLFYNTLGVFLSRERRRSLGNYLASRASGDGDTNHATNGEQNLLNRVKLILAKENVPKITAIDGGANVGHWTQRFAEGLGANATIYAFEPVKYSYEEMMRNLARWKLSPTIVPIMAALSNEDGEASIFITNDQASELNSLHQRQDSAAVQYRRGDMVRLIKGDTLCAEKSIDRIDLLKIDTEGHEMAVLAGFARMLAEKRVEVIQFEYGGAWLDARTQLSDAFKLLSQHGYTVSKLHPKGVKIHDRYTQALETFRYGNYVAFLPKWAQLLNVID